MMLLVLLLGGCSSDDVCQDNPGKRSVIGFDNGMVDNAVATRAGVTPLAIHHETMGVWGWEAPGDDSEHILFSNQKVSYDDEAGNGLIRHSSTGLTMHSTVSMPMHLTVRMHPSMPKTER